jgi:uncharacterized membrane protein YphA (DoxX/SURF4 family)
MRRIAYWSTTILLSLAYFAGGVADVLQPDPVKEAAAQVGYPLLFFTILGVWKLAAAVAVIAPRLPRAKEWAYAGIAINLSSAAITHAAANHAPGDIATPIFILAMALVSYTTRPESRRLAGPVL